MDDALQKKITILVNVHNRHRHLARQLDYIHEHYDRILVCDSSDVEYAGKDEYPNVEYLYYPQWEYVDKLADIVKRVETPYVHLCADDDFYVPESVAACVEFMESRPDYASAHGHYLSFHWDGQHFDTYPLYTHYIGQDIGSDDLEIRLNEVFKIYIQLLYGVHRTRNLRDSFCLACRNNVKNHRLVEILVTVLSVIKGKHRVLPMLYGARETLYNSAGTFVPSIRDMLENSSLREEYKRFNDLIAAYISDEHSINKEGAGEMFGRVFESYMNYSTIKQSPMLNRLPVSLRILIKRYLYRSIGYIADDQAANEHLREIQEMVKKHDIVADRG